MTGVLGRDHPGSGRPVRVAVDATPLLGHRTGIGHSTAALLEELADRLDVTLRAYAVTWSGRRNLATLVPHGVTPCARRVPARAARWLWRRADHPRIERWTGPVDVVHGTNFVAPPSRAPAIVTVHDLTCVRFPELCTSDTLEYPRLLRRALDRGAVVHVVSDTVADEVRDTFSLAADRVVRIYPGVMSVTGGDPASGRALSGRDRYVLALGTIEPRKNLEALVRAFDAVAADDDTLGLVLAGPDGLGASRVHDAIAGARSAARITTLGYVDDPTRADLLAGSTAFAYPSLYEGFGHPPLEAMSVGIPVVATRAGALGEVLGDAALLVDPSDDDALASGLARVVTESALRDELVERGRTRTQRYSWTASADEMAALYRRVER